MKHIKIFYSILLLLLLGCNNWLDVNDDPNYLSDLNSPEVVLPSTQVGIANTILGWDMGFSGAFWSQYWTQDHNASQYKFLDNYQENAFDNAYGNLYPSILINLDAIKVSSDTLSGDYLAAELLSIYSWQLVTDTWGEMPYFEALMGEDGLVSPMYDTQQDIYTDLINRIDIILNADYSKATLSSKYDFIFHGDIKSWMQFANSLKLKLKIRLSETPEYNNSDLLSFVQNGDFLTSKNAQISGDIWENKTGKQHPMNEYQNFGANYFSTNVIASKTMVDYLLINADPRIDKLYDQPSSGTHRGGFQGDYASYEASDGTTLDKDVEYSTVSYAPDADIQLMSNWEVDFYIAEVYARAGDQAKAKMYYDMGVQASTDYWGVSNTITVPGGYGEWKNGTVEEGIKQIAMQKWVAYCKLQNIEAFFERNRTKYPSVNEIDIANDRRYAYENFPVGEFTISVEGRGRLSGSLPASALFPSASITRNPNAPGQKTNVGVHVWWDQKMGK